MTKKQALFRCKELSRYGYMTHTMILDIYDDDEEVPDDVLDLICYEPKPRDTPVFICGKTLSEQIDMALTHLTLLLNKDENTN